jgi:branched-chain amino acid transport system substrate-binding protein
MICDADTPRPNIWTLQVMLRKDRFGGRLSGAFVVSPGRRSIVGAPVFKRYSGWFARVGRLGFLRSVLVGGLAAGGLAFTAGAPSEAAGVNNEGVTSKTIAIGLINDTTGAAASTFSDGVGAAQARVDLQNAEGGVDGRKLKLVTVDSQSSPAEFQTAAEALVSKSVFGIVSDSAFTFGGSRYLTQQNVPVTGNGLDGPEWGTAPNMFSYDPPTFTTYHGTSYGYDFASILLKSLGVKKTAVLTYGNSPSGILSAQHAVAEDSKLGIQNCYEDLSVPFGSMDFTAVALVLKQNGCDGVIGTFTASSNIALALAIRDAGLNIKQFYYTSYAQSTLSSAAAESALDNTYSEGLTVSGHTSSAAALRKFYSELKKYDPSYKGGIPDLGVTTSWDSTDMMIEGLKLAGPNPTRAAFVAKLRTVKNYTLGGLSTTPIDFNYLAGHLPSTECVNLVELKGNRFVPVPSNGAATCGKLVPYRG